MVSLCVDIGNSLAKLAVFDEDRMIYFQSFLVGDVLFLNSIVENYEIEVAIISSVADVPESLIDFLQKRLSGFFILDHQTALPIENCYQTKETLGKDRLAAVVGAISLYPGEDLLIIDAGTAITYDIITKGAQYLGGNISPGIQMRFKALHTFTSKLPMVPKVEDYVLYGRNTNEAINSGVLLGTIAEVDGIIDHFREEFGSLRVVFTGGDAAFFGQKLKNTIFVVHNLVPLGLNKILQFNLGRSLV